MREYYDLSFLTSVFTTSRNRRNNLSNHCIYPCNNSDSNHGSKPLYFSNLLEFLFAENNSLFFLFVKYKYKYLKHLISEYIHTQQYKIDVLNSNLD